MHMHMQTLVCRQRAGGAPPERGARLRPWPGRQAPRSGWPGRPPDERSVYAVMLLGGRGGAPRLHRLCADIVETASHHASSPSRPGPYSPPCRCGISWSSSNPACSRLLILTLSRMSPRLVRSEATSAVRPSSMAARRRSETTSAERPSDVAARPRSSPGQHISYENVARSDHLASRARALLLCFLFDRLSLTQQQHLDLARSGPASTPPLDIDGGSRPGMHDGGG